MKILIATCARTLLAAALLAGCAPQGARQADSYFVLDVARDGGAASAPAAAVRIEPLSAAGFYDTQDIVFSRAPGTRAYYQFNHWTERPHHAIETQLMSRFGPRSTDFPRGDAPVLRVHLEEIYHDAFTPPGAARISLTAELVDPATRAVFARRGFRASAPAASHDATGAVQASRQALASLIDDMAIWIGASIARAPAAPPR